MPWRRKPTKGAASGDTPRGGADGLRSGGARMGEPSGGHAPLSRPELIGPGKATRGTETSQYPEEEKSTEIPGVAASGTGLTPKPARATRPQPCPAGVAGRAGRGLRGPSRGDKPEGQRNGVGKPAEAGESPVREGPPAAGAALSSAGHEEPRAKQGGPPSKAEHSPATDSGPVP